MSSPLSLPGDSPHPQRCGTAPDLTRGDSLAGAPSKDISREILKEKRYKRTDLKDLFKELPLDPVLRKKELWRLHRLIYFRNYRFKQRLKREQRKRNFKSIAKSQTIRRTRESRYTNGWSIVQAKYGTNKSLSFAEWQDYGFFDKYNPKLNRILMKDPSKRNRHIDNILLIQKIIPNDNNRQPKSRKRATKARYKILIDPRPDIPILNTRYLIDRG